MQIKRHKTRSVQVGNLTIGGNAPISIQSMTNTLTQDVDATVRQINRLTDAGADIVRVAVPTQKDTAALKEILAQVRVPIVADVHFHFDRALEAISAGVHKIRLNPGNIRDRDKVARVIGAAKDANIPIRIGVNSGSIRTSDQLETKVDPRHMTKLMIEELDSYIRFFQAQRFEKLVLSAKSSDVPMTIALCQAIAKRYDYPLHLGLTHAGTVLTGSVRSADALGVLLFQGIGDTIRVSLSGDPVEEIYIAKQILADFGLRKFSSPELICCPTCGRCQIDLPKLAVQVEKQLRKIHKPVKVALMGCIVNGPGEAADADIALVAGRDCGFIYIKGKRIIRVTGPEMIKTLLRYIKIF
ncbi:MAG: flavodoxin-dependent (E)-4-hydroxy-3-methylbut-2-enyl-diphosphate synthase [Phycisphaerae bacterium]